MTEATTRTLDAPGATITYDVRPGGDGSQPPLMLIGAPMGAAGFVSLCQPLPGSDRRDLRPARIGAQHQGRSRHRVESPTSTPMICIGSSRRSAGRLTCSPAVAARSTRWPWSPRTRRTSGRWSPTSRRWPPSCPMRRTRRRQCAPSADSYQQRRLRRGHGALHGDHRPPWRVPGRHRAAAGPGSGPVRHARPTTTATRNRRDALTRTSIRANGDRALLQSGMARSGSSATGAWAASTAGRDPERSDRSAGSSPYGLGGRIRLALVDALVERSSSARSPGTWVALGHLRDGGRIPRTDARSLRVSLGPGRDPAALAVIVLAAAGLWTSRSWRTGHGCLDARDCVRCSAVLNASTRSRASVASGCQSRACCWSAPVGEALIDLVPDGMRGIGQMARRADRRPRLGSGREGSGQDPGGDWRRQRHRS